MNALLLAMAITAASAVELEAPRIEAVASASEMVAALADEVETGTLLVSTGDCLAVKVYTRSPFTHVGTVVIRQGRPFVYDSMNGVGVRCQTLENYLASQRIDELHVFHPRQLFSSEQSAVFEQYLDSQLGRPYSIHHHVTGRPVEGLHCSEYVTAALQECSLLKAQNPAKVSPASLVSGILKNEAYVSAGVWRLEEAPTETEGDNWCEGLWLDTKRCTKLCYSKVSGWFLCR